MKNKSKPGMKITAVLLACVLGVCCFTTACQPVMASEWQEGGDVTIGITPEEADQAAAELREEVTEQTAEPQESALPQRFTASIEEGYLKVSADAAVNVPDVEALPVLQVTPSLYTQEDLDVVKDYFWGDVLMDDASMWYTRSQLEEAIADFEAELETVRAGGDGADEDALVLYISEFKEKLKTAPEEAEPMQYPQIRTDYEKGKLFDIVDTTADVGGSTGWLRLMNWHDLYNPGRNISSYHASPFYGTGIVETTGTTESLIGRQAEGVSTTPEQAVQLVRQTLADLGIEGMTLEYVAAGCAQISGNFVPDTQGYYIRFCDAVNGIPVIHNGSWQEENRIYPTREQVIATVDDTGVTTFDWWDKMDVQDTVTEDAQLLPFEQIEERFAEYIREHYAWANGQTLYLEDENGQAQEEHYMEGTEDVNVRIDRVELEYASVKDAESPTGFLYIPVWAFYGDAPFTAGEQYAANAPFNAPHCHMVINAIDGSRVWATA